MARRESRIAAGIKSLAYMRDISRRAALSPSEQGNFRSFELNQPGAVSREMITDVSLWKSCESKRKPERSGDCFVGFDLGGSSSMTAAAAYWPECGRLDCWGAFGDIPTLLDRGEFDGVSDRYLRMQQDGELRTWAGRVTPVAEFLNWLGEQLADEYVVLAAADRYRQAEGLDALAQAEVCWPMEWRAQGSAATVRQTFAHFRNQLKPGRCALANRG